MPVSLPYVSELQRLPGWRRMRTRFAPSVTGFLHLGHLVNAVYVWGIARAIGGEVALRLEDHDRGRFRPEYEAAILDDLDWLGLTPDVGTTAEFRAGSSPWRQSDGSVRYEAALEKLRAMGLTYACECSRSTLARAGGRDDGEEERRYPGTCRDKGLTEDAGRRIRVRMEPGVERFDDLRLGPQEQDPSAQCGDLVARDVQGDWTYQFAVAVDDYEQDISLVIRGLDLLASTGRQLRLARLLGRPEPPRYLHHPLVTDAAGRKLSKRDFARSIADHRAEGRTPESLLGEAAFLGGLRPEARPLGAAELPGLFG
ncbi:MAG TPA: glutamate--tRNA ligase family protein [Gemmatimonadales bacterium]|nr:glutamate--tRNA ligase family protein [Gemmatimonadales bacterium]